MVFDSFFIPKIYPDSSFHDSHLVKYSYNNVGKCCFSYLAFIIHHPNQNLDSYDKVDYNSAVNY